MELKGILSLFWFIPVVFFYKFSFVEVLDFDLTPFWL